MCVCVRPGRQFLKVCCTHLPFPWRWAQKPSAMVEERKCVVKRLQRLFERATLEDLQSTESHLRDLVQLHSFTVKANNPEGSQEAGPCKVCKGARPPASDAQPWHTRVNSSGEEIARSGVCVCRVCGASVRARTEVSGHTGRSGARDDGQ